MEFKLKMEVRELNLCDREYGQAVGDVNSITSGEFHNW
jgi:hypothetical protein